METRNTAPGVSRRVVMRGAAAAPLAMALPDAAYAQAAQNLSAGQLRSLVRIARDIFPHDTFPDSLYLAAVTPYDAQAGSNADTKALIEQGLARLDADAQARHGAAYAALNWEDQRVALLRGIEHTPFFRKLRGDLVVSLYNQKEVWTRLGYEGSSAEHGGYISRGFDDLDWV